MLKKIARTCGSRVITSSASTTPCASPPPPRSQKLAGRPPTNVTTSTVDIVSPAPFPSTPTSPSSFTYVTPFSRASASSGSAAPRSRISAMSGMPVERVVVDRELRVERAHLALRRDDERVDLAEHRLAADERLVELPGDRRRSASARPGSCDPALVDEAARVPRAGSPRADRRGAGRAPPGSSPRPPRCPSRPAS